MKKLKLIFLIIAWPINFIVLNLWSWSYMLLSLLPHPKILKGSRFLVVEDIKSTGLTHWRAPMTDGFRCKIPKGTILIATTDSQRISRGISLIPERYEELGNDLVPEGQRNSAKYVGYSFVLNFSQIGRKLKPINSEGDGGTGGRLGGSGTGHL